MDKLQWAAKKTAYEYFNTVQGEISKEEKVRVELWIYDIYLAVGAPVSQHIVGDVVNRVKPEWWAT